MATVTTPELASIANRPPALSVSEYVTVLVVASASLAAAVIPTAVPLAAFSSTALAATLLSAGVVTSNSSTSPIVMVNVRVVVVVSLLVARTVMSYVPAASRSIPPATVTTPVVAWMANRPPALSSSE